MHKPSRSTPSAEQDTELFATEMSDVQPLKSPARANLTQPKPRPLPLKRLEDNRAVIDGLLTDSTGWEGDIESGDLITFLRPGLPPDLLRKLKRGHWVIQESIDLHGETAATAHQRLVAFLAHVRQRGLRCIRIVHGKGHRSAQQVPVLRNKVRCLLSRRNEILAFCDAAPADGGSGAVVVLLKGSP